MTSISLLTDREVADALKVKLKTIQLWARAGKLKAVKCGDLWRFRPEVIERFISAGGMQ